MSDPLDLDDIEQMYTDIISDSPDPLRDAQVRESHRRLSEAIESPGGKFFEYSETPTPAHEAENPLEFSASPIEKTAEYLRSESTSNASTPTGSRASLTEATTNELVVKITKPQESDDPVVSHRRTSSIATQRLEAIARTGTAAEIRAERESTSAGIVSPNLSANPEDAIEKAIRRVSAGSSSFLDVDASFENPTSLLQPKAVPTHRRASSNAIDDSEDIDFLNAPLANTKRSPSSPRTLRLESIAAVGSPMQIRAERESTSIGILSPNLSENPEESIEKAIRRASSNQGSPPRTKRLESLASEGSPSQIRAERESTSIGVIQPNLSPHPEAAIEKAIRRASSTASPGAVDEDPSSPKPRHRRLSSNAIDDTEDIELPATTKSGRAMSSPRTLRLESLAAVGSPAQIREERESTSLGVLSPNLSENPEEALEKAIRRASSSAGSTGSPTRTKRLESLATEGSPAEIRAERESTSQGVTRPELSVDPEVAIEKAICRASSSAGSDDAKRLEALANKGSPAEIRAERESTSQGVTRPELSADPEAAIEKAIRRVSSSAGTDDTASNRPRAGSIEGSMSADLVASPRPRRGSTASVDNPNGDSLEKLQSELQSPRSGAAVREPSVPAIAIVEEDEEVTVQATVSESSSAVETKVVSDTPDTTSGASSAIKQTRGANEVKVSPHSVEAEETHETTEVKEVNPRDTDTVYLYMSMASGGRGAMQNFQRASSILQTYNITFVPVEISIDEKAKRIWKYRGIAKNKKLPAVVRDGEIKLDFEELLAANEDEEVEEIIFEEF